MAVFASDKKLQLDLAVSEEEHPEYSVHDRIVLATFVIALATITWGLITHGWYMVERVAKRITTAKLPEG